MARLESISHSCHKDVTYARAERMASGKGLKESRQHKQNIRHGHSVHDRFSDRTLDTIDTHDNWWYLHESETILD